MTAKWMVENWAILFSCLCVMVGCFMTIRKFKAMPTEQQIANIKEWLLFACIEAEKELGSGTGKLKLRSVYDKFVQAFPSFGAVVPFTLFSVWVDEALLRMQDMLKTNNALKMYVEEVRWEDK